MKNNKETLVTLHKTQTLNNYILYALIFLAPGYPQIRIIYQVKK